MRIWYYRGLSMKDEVIWVIAAVGVASGILFDMSRLKIRRVVVPQLGWVLASLCVGPAAAAVYMLARRRTRRRLIDLVRELVGDEAQPAPVRRARLVELHRNGLVGDPIFVACLREIEPGGPPAG